MIPDLAERRQRLSNLGLHRGQNTKEKNLAAVLDMLWAIKNGDSAIERAVFEPSYTRLRDFFTKLNMRGCIRIVEECGFGGGHVITQIVVLRKQLPPGKPRPIATNVVVEKKEAPQAPVQETRPPCCLVFIDVPNITFYVENEYNARTHFMSMYRANWSALLDAVVHITGIPRAQQTAHAFFRNPGEQNPRFDVLLRCMKHDGIHASVRQHPTKDVDPMMDAAIVSETIMQMVSANREIHVVVVSGDCDRAFALREVRRWAKMLKVDLRTHIIAWKAGISDSEKSELKASADSVDYVEEFLRAVDPKGFQLYMEHNQRDSAVRTLVRQRA